MNKMKLPIVISGIVLLLFGIYAHSSELSGQIEINTLPCELETSNMELHNDSGEEKTYRISIGSAETNWFNVVPNEITIGPGESGSLRVFTIAGCYAKPGTYSAELVAETNGEKLRKTIRLVLKQGHFIGVKILQSGQKASQCEEKTYDVELTNNTLVPNQNFERVDLLVSGIPDNWFSLENERVLVEKGNPKIAKLKVKAPCDATFGYYDFTVTASLPNPDFRSSANATHTITQGQEAKISIPSSSQDSNGVAFKTCLEEKSMAIVKISNEGKQQDNYKVLLEGPSFAQLKTTRLSLGQGKEAQIEIAISPTGQKAGTYDFKLKMESTVFDYSTYKEFKVKLEDCYGVEIEKLEGPENACSEEKPLYKFMLKNNRTKLIELKASLKGINGSMEPQTVSIQQGAEKEIRAVLDVSGYAKAGSSTRSNLAIELLVDTSGSMVEKKGNEQKIEIARREIIKLANSISEVELGMRVFGQGSMCEDSKLEMPIAKLDVQRTALNAVKIEPKGKTPLAQAIKAAALDFPNGKEKAIILISDGKETCNGNVQQSAREAAEKGIVIYAIGFDIDNEGKAQLKDAAEATKGKYFEAQNSEELSMVLREISKELDIVAGEKGENTFTLLLESENFSFEKDFKIEISDCHNAAMVAPELFLCRDIEKKDTVSIVNLGSQAQEFTLEYSPNWVSGEGKATVGPNEKKSIAISAKAPESSTEKKYIVTAKSNGISLRQDAALNYMPESACYGIDILLPISEIEASACEGKKLKLYIENRGAIEQEVTLKADKAYAHLVQDKLTVKAGQRKEAEFFITPPFDLPATTFITFEAITNNGFDTSAKIKLKVQGNQDSFGLGEPDMRVKNMNISKPKDLNYEVEVQFGLLNDASKPIRVLNATAKAYNALLQLEKSVIEAGKTANARLLVDLPEAFKSGKVIVPISIETDAGTFSREITFDYNAEPKATDFDKNAAGQAPDQNKATGKGANDTNEIAGKAKEAKAETIKIGTGLFNLADFTTAALIGLIALVVLLIALAAYNAVQEESKRNTEAEEAEASPEKIEKQIQAARKKKK